LSTGKIKIASNAAPRYLTLFPATGNNGDSPDLDGGSRHPEYKFEGEPQWQTNNRNRAPMNLVYVPSRKAKSIAATSAGMRDRARWRSPASAIIPLAR
jgi:hypothetical protein